MIARALVAAALVAVIGRGARADGVGVIASGAAGAGADRAAVAAAMADAIAASGGRAVPDAIGAAHAALAAGAVPSELLARFRHARELADDGWRAYLRVSFDVAARQLAAAREEAEPLVALSGGAELYADASLRLGAVLAHLGRADDARAAIALALALDPGRPVTLADFAPDVIALVDGVRAAPIVAQHVRIAAEPAGALVAVDGTALGVSPVEAELARGQHVVIARAPLHAPRAVGVAVDDTTTSVRVELDRDPDAEAVAAGADGAATDEGARRLVDTTLRFAGVEEVVVVASVVRRGAPALVAMRCAAAGAGAGAGGAACTEVVEIGYADRDGLASAARAAWAAVRAASARGAAVAVSGAGAGERGGTPSRCALCRNPYVIGGAGAAIVLGAIAIVLATSGSHPAPAVSVNPGDFGK